MLRVVRFKSLKLPKELVVLGVANRRLRKYVVSVGVVV
jgi:hypothetical protein